MAFLKDVFAGFRLGLDSLGGFLFSSFTESWLAGFLTECRHLSSAIRVEGWVCLIRSKLGLDFVVAVTALSAR